MNNVEEYPIEDHHIPLHIEEHHIPNEENHIKIHRGALNTLGKVEESSIEYNNRIYPIKYYHIPYPQFILF